MPSHPDRVRRNYEDSSAKKVEDIIESIKNGSFKAASNYYPCERYSEHIFDMNMNCIFCRKTALELNARR